MVLSHRELHFSTARALSVVLEHDWALGVWFLSGTTARKCQDCNSISLGGDWRQHGQCCFRAHQYYYYYYCMGPWVSGTTAGNWAVFGIALADIRPNWDMLLAGASRQGGGLDGKWRLRLCSVSLELVAVILSSRFMWPHLGGDGYARVGGLVFGFCLAALSAVNLHRFGTIGARQGLALSWRRPCFAAALAAYAALVVTLRPRAPRSG
jgi:hypothetical protein